MSQESAESLIKAAGNKDPEAAFKVAVGLTKGKYGLKRSPDKALKYFKIAADSGNIDAINRYADIQMQNKKYDDASKYYQLGIKKKSPYSMVAYGKYLQDIEHNDEKSAKFFKAASDLKDPEGMYYYASVLFQQTKNDQAKDLLRKSAELGYYESLHFLSVILKEEEDKLEAENNTEQQIFEDEPESEKVEEQYRMEKKKKQNEELEEKIHLANDENDAEAMLWLVEKYEKEPLRKNRLKALPYYKKLAKLQDVESIRHLQLMYKYGRDVDMDINEYFKYTKQLADRGEVDSMLKVADMYQKGEGCQASEELYKKYKEKAAEGSYKQIKVKLAEVQKMRQARKAKNTPNPTPIQPSEKEYEDNILNEAYKLALQLINGEVYLPDFQKGYQILQILANFHYQDALNEVLNYLLRPKELNKTPNEEDIVKYLKLKKDDGYVLDLAHLFLNGNLDKLVLKQDGPVITFFKQFAIDRKDQKLLSKFANGYKHGKPPLIQNTNEYINLIKILAKLENKDAIEKLRFIYEKEGINNSNSATSINDIQSSSAQPQQNAENDDKSPRKSKSADLRRLKERADANNGSNAFAMINYAKILIEGKGLDQPDVEEGIKYLKKAALQCNNSTAMFELGEIYETGKIVKKDLGEAVKFYDLGDKNGNHQCAFNLVKCLLLNKKGAEAKDVIKKSGDQEFSEKLFNKLLYEWKIEPDEVARLLKIAADAGDVGSMKILSKYLIRGRNVTHNPEEAQIYLNMYNKSTKQ